MALLLSFPTLSTAMAGRAEIKGKITNQLTQEQYRAVTVIITDRLGTEMGRTHPNGSGRYQIKVSGPRYVIIKALLEGYPTALHQVDTEQYRESTTDREENRVFGQMRILTFYQDITFPERGSVAAEAAGPLTLEDLLAGEDATVVKAYQKARRRKEGGNLKGAVQDLEKLVKEYPNFYIGYIDLGMILAARQENDRALEIFTRARELRPGHSWAYVGLGVALNNKQDYGSAAQYLKKAVELEPNSVNAQFQLGHASFKLGEKERALDCFQRVIELDPTFHPLAYKTLASLYVGRQDTAGAAQALEAYLTHFPDAADAPKVRQILAKLRP
ncbi:tetratricopeptide repeat protein [Acidobacteria bacterium AH-259-A15]|nr:tetratricopeptide repeat protein [Acidobacteria bacterium AH-259-A15]